ncbi:alpha/beta hydrolase [Nocardia brasiliensis]|nr:alpha/beta hydrolase [Nocardia brasiliensis]
MIADLDEHQVRAVQLPLTSLTDDIAWTRRGISNFDGPVTLVGHSYGGMVISGAAEHNEQVDALVFVAAYAPGQDEMVASLSDRGAKMPGGEAIRLGEGGWSTIDSGMFADVLAAGVPGHEVQGVGRNAETDPRRMLRPTFGTRRVARPAVRLRAVAGRSGPRPLIAMMVRRAHELRSHRIALQPSVPGRVPRRGGRRHQRNAQRLKGPCGRSLRYALRGPGCQQSPKTVGGLATH